MKLKKLLICITCCAVVAGVLFSPSRAYAAKKANGPSELSVEIADDTVTVSWSKVKGAKKYEYWYSPDYTEGMDKGEYTKGYTKNTSIITSGDSSHTYFVKVRAVFKSGNKKTYSKWAKVTNPVSENPLVGGIEINSEVAEKGLSNEEEKIFNEAVNGLTGVDYEPVAVVAKQVVAGMNYMYLTKSKVVYPGASSKWTMVAVYKPLSGSAGILGFSDLDPASPKVASSNEILSGGWFANDEGKGLKLPAGAQKAFNAAVSGADGISFESIALIGTQVVNGTNYYILSYGTTTTAEPQRYLYLLQINASPDGEGATIPGFSMIDIGSYSGN